MDVDELVSAESNFDSQHAFISIPMAQNRADEVSTWLSFDENRIYRGALGP